MGPATRCLSKVRFVFPALVTLLAQASPLFLVGRDATRLRFRSSSTKASLNLFTCQASLFLYEAQLSVSPLEVSCGKAAQLSRLRGWEVVPAELREGGFPCPPLEFSFGVSRRVPWGEALLRPVSSFAYISGTEVLAPPPLQGTALSLGDRDQALSVPQFS